MNRIFALAWCLTLATIPLIAQVRDSSFGIVSSVGSTVQLPGGTGCDFGGQNDRDDRAYLAVHLQDGRIVLAGDTRGSDGSDFAIARLLPDGQYDQSAGTDGQVRLDLGYPDDSCLTAARYENDRILMGGCVNRPGAQNRVILLARIDMDGHLDTGFGNSGHLTIDLASDHEMATEIWPMPDGKIIVAGNALFGSSLDFPDSTRVFIGRLLPNGKTDSTFGVNGFVYQHWEQRCNAALLGDLSVDASGRIVITGGSYDPYPGSYGWDDFCEHHLFLFRYLQDGTPDITFGDNGLLMVSDTRYSKGNSLLHYEDGRILLAAMNGEALLESPVYPLILRFMPDGTPDQSFGTNGRFQQTVLFGGIISGGFVEPLGFLRMRDRILVLSVYDVVLNNLGFGAFCFTESGAIDSTFGTDGKFNFFPDAVFGTYINQISSTSEGDFFFSGYYRILNPNNMGIFKARWDKSSGTIALSNFKALSIYPNPVQGDYFQVDWEENEGGIEDFSISIRDLNGRTLFKKEKITRLEKINTSSFPAGLYFAEVTGADKHYIGKVVVARK